MSYENIEVIQDGLRRVVTQGSGKRLGSLPLEVSGKTGTAQWHPSKPPHAWFAGYAPTVTPQIAFSILVEEGEEGSKIAVSIANDLLLWWYENRIAIE
jgi:penicillin-binding protein 2